MRRLKVFLSRLIEPRALPSTKTLLATLTIALCLYLPLSHSAHSQDANNAEIYKVFEQRIEAAINTVRYEEALAIAVEYAATAGRGEGKSSEAFATALSHQALILMLLNDFGKARDLYEEALALYQQSSAPDRAVARTLNNLGEVNKFEGKKKVAEAYYDKALALQERSLPADDPDLATTLANLSQVRDDVGVREGLLRRALTIREKGLDADHPTLAGNLQSLAAVMEEQGKLRDAEELLRRAITIRRTSQAADSPYLAGALHKLGNNLFRQGRHDESEELLKQALDLRLKSQSFFLDTGRNYADLAQVYLVEGDRSVEAEKALQQAIDFYRKGLPEDHSYFADAYYGLGYLESDRNNAREALDWLRKATAIGVINQQETSEENRSKETKFHFQDHVKFAWENYLPDRPFKLADEAFVVAQRAGTSDIGNTVARMSARLAARSPMLASLAREKQDLEDRRREAGHELMSAMALGQRERISSVRSERDLLSARISELDDRILQRFPKYRTLVQPEPLKIAEVQSLLNRDEVLIFYFLTYDDVFVWAIGRDRVTWNKLALDADGIAARVSQIRASLELENPKQAPESERLDLALTLELYQHLFNPIASAIGRKKKLIIVAPGALATLPFQALVASSPSSSTRDVAAYSNADWLVNKYAISILPSPASLKSLRQLGKGPEHRKAMIGFGNPEFGGAPPQQGEDETCIVRRNVVFDPERLRDLDRLPCTETELKGVAGYLGTRNSNVYLGADASETAVKQAKLDRYKLVYFATHAGLIDDQGVLILSLPKTASALDDGILTAAEVAELKLNADWVVLSACNTAAGNGKGAEALSGLAQSFFYAGSRALLVSHWEVVDEAAVKLLLGTFDSMKQSQKIGRAVALQKSMQKMIAQTRGTWLVYPSYWAVYFVVGLPN